MKDFKMYDRVSYYDEECSFVECRPIISSQYGCLIERKGIGWKRNEAVYSVPKKYKNIWNGNFWNVHLDEITLIKRHNQQNQSVKYILTSIK
jgi:hypothetical protein